MPPGVMEAVMRTCLQEARKGEGRVDPNPMVGAALTDARGEILALAHHAEAGREHAEAALLGDFARVSPDSVVFVTLEPCGHWGKTPPCVDLLLAMGVGNLVIGTLDPNPLMNGKSVERLRKNGVNVVTGVLAEECERVNAVFNHHVVCRRPYVAIKAGTSLDGKIALADGSSRWITDPTARGEAHRLRSCYQAVAIGAGTLEKDDPRLDNRQNAGSRQPVRILFAGDRVPDAGSNWATLEHSRRMMVVREGRERLPWAEALRQTGVEILIQNERGIIDDGLMKELYRKGVCSMMVEGGSRLIASFLASGFCRGIHLFVAPRIVGGEGLSWCGGLNLKSLEETPQFELETLEKCGNGFVCFLKKAQHGS